MQKSFIALSLLVVSLLSCSNKEQYHSLSGFAQGTTYNITYQGGEDYSADIDNYLQEFDNSLSFYSDSSLLTQLNSGESQLVDTLFSEVFNLSKTINNLTDGYFDPTVGALFRAYGFAGGKPKMLNQSELDSIMVGVGLSKVALENGLLVRENNQIKLDFSGVAQGMSVDMVANLLEQRGVQNYMIEIGGEIISSGFSPSGRLWRIGIDTPEQGNMISGANISTIVEIGGNSGKRGLATSGNYRKFMETDAHELITHTLNPLTGHPASHNLLSATIIAESSALADGFATAAMVGGLEWTRSRVDSLRGVGYNIDCVLIYSDSLQMMQTYSTLPAL
ncbi:MAG: FAD:protein FMN transferase [Rikenellaceae bacterium]